MNKKNFSYREFILIYALIIVFMVSMFIIHIDYRIDKLGARVDCVEKVANKIVNNYGN